MRAWIVGAAAVLALGVAMAQDEEEAKMLDTGAKAPDFRLNDQDGKAIRLSDLKGKSWAVVAFFPKAATPG